MTKIEAPTDADRARLLKRLSNDIEYLKETYATNEHQDKRSIDYEFGNHDLTLGDLKTIRSFLTPAPLPKIVGLREVIEAMNKGFNLSLEEQNIRNLAAREYSARMEGE